MTFMIIKEFLNGIRAYPRAHKVIKDHKLWPYIIIPGIISLCYVFLMVVVGKIYFPELIAYIWTHWVPSFMRWEFVRIITGFALWIIFILTIYITYQPVILVVFSPVLAILSETTEKRAYNREFPHFKLKAFFRDIVRSVHINLRNTALMIFFIIPAWLFIFIPVIGTIISAVLIFLIQSHYNGFSLADYTLERKRLPVKQRIEFAKTNRGRILGIGAGFMLIVIIPVLGWFMAPAYGTVAATLATLDVLDKETDKTAIST